MSHFLLLSPAFLVPQALLARQTSGMSGADLANLVNEAALLAAKLGADAIAPSMVDYAYDKVLMGVERKSAVRSPEALKRTAYHEGGHALVSGTVFAGRVVGGVY
jgi:ATP-dependent Zn protease